MPPACRMAWLGRTTNSRLKDIVDISIHGMLALLKGAKLPSYMCPPCPRTPVHHVPGLYRGLAPNPLRPRRDLHGGRWATGVPTVTTFSGNPYMLEWVPLLSPISRLPVHDEHNRVSPVWCPDADGPNKLPA